jgi:hypothetical protein
MVYGCFGRHSRLCLSESANWPSGVQKLGRLGAMGVSGRAGPRAPSVGRGPQDNRGTGGSMNHQTSAKGSRGRSGWRRPRLTGRNDGAAAPGPAFIQSGRAPRRPFQPIRGARSGLIGGRRTAQAADQPSRSDQLPERQRDVVTVVPGCGDVRYRRRRCGGHEGVVAAFHPAARMRAVASLRSFRDLNRAGLSHRRGSNRPVGRLVATRAEVTKEDYRLAHYRDNEGHDNRNEKIVSHVVELCCLTPIRWGALQDSTITGVHKFGRAAQSGDGRSIGGRGNMKK